MAHPKLALARSLGASVSVAALLSFPPAPAVAQICGLTLDQTAAHLSHTRASPARAALACAECHPQVCDPAGERVTFGALAASGGATPSWDAGSRTCSGVYCHGATLSPPTGPVSWTWVDPAAPKPPGVECAMCHGYPPPPPHPAISSCHDCHPAVVRADGTIDLEGGRHVDGVLDVAGGAGGCGACHGYPPATGAHVAHFGLGAEAAGGYADLRTLEGRFPAATPADAPAVYAFGCAECHSVDETNHRNGSVEVLLAEPGAPAGSLKARAAPGAAWHPATGTCSGVYCHSSGQAAPAYRTTPTWTADASIGCDGCHDNPPAYPSGGEAAATANSHLALADDGYEFGHFLGMPGPFHSSKHGGGYWGPDEDAAPITCQTCHFETADPSNTGPGGFYYLDTTGRYALPGGDPYRVQSGWQAEQQCGFCHHEAGAATGAGRVLPLRHVNGVRDVDFDPRPALPALAWLPAVPDQPARPYWMTGTGPSMPWPADAVFDGTTVSFGLGGAAYDPATKRCSGVACHLADGAPVWGRPYQWLTGGGPTCDRCHPM